MMVSVLWTAIFQRQNFFTEFERFDRFVDKWHRDTGKRIEFVSICSPQLSA